MKMLKDYYVTYFIPVFLASLFWGCQKNSDNDKQAYQKSFIHPLEEITNQKTFQDFLIDYGIDLFHSNVIAHEGQLIISSQGGGLISTTVSGDVNWSLERPGYGPGEFDIPQDMQIAENRIGILNSDRSRVSLYTIDGEFYKDVQLDIPVMEFAMVNNELHIFYMFDDNYLFASYDFETDEKVVYGKKHQIPELSGQINEENFLRSSHLISADDRYTALGLPYYTLLIIFDRSQKKMFRMDLSDQKEIEASLAWHRKDINNSQDVITAHFLDLVKIGNYFGLSVPGPPDRESALMYRIIPSGQIYDKIYRPSGDVQISQMENFTLLNNGTYFGHITSQDRLLIVSMSDGK